MNKKRSVSGFIARSGIIASLYVVLTLPLGALAYSPFIQVRPAEALTILPLFMPSSIVGVTIGCMIVNIFGGGLIDMAIGGSITLIAGLITRYSKKFYFGVLPPIILNALGLPLMFLLLDIEIAYFYTFLQILLSQTIWVVGLGYPLYRFMQRAKEKEMFLLY